MFFLHLFNSSTSSFLVAFWFLSDHGSLKNHSKSRIITLPYPVSLQTLHNLFSPASHAWNKVLSAEFLPLNKRHSEFFFAIYKHKSLRYVQDWTQSSLFTKLLFYKTSNHCWTRAVMFKVPFSESWTAIKPAVEAIRNYDIHMLTSRKLNCCFIYFAILVNVFFYRKINRNLAFT